MDPAMVSHEVLLIGACLFLAALPLAERRLRRLGNGANVCLWFRGRNISSPEDSAAYIDDAEMAQMRRMGIRHVRLCVQPDYVYDPSNPAEPIEPNLSLVEDAIGRFIRHGIAVVFDFHNEYQPRLESTGPWRDGLVAFWRALAGRLSKFDPEDLVLEAVNEPVFKGREQDWLDFQPKLLAAIREGAPDHTIIASGTDWSNIGHLTRMRPLPDENLIYTFHCYDPHIFTHQGATWSEPYYPLLKGVPYPSSPQKLRPLVERQADPTAKEALRRYGEQRWDSEKLRGHLHSAVDWASVNQVPLYCGEFGCYTLVTPMSDRLQWFKDISSAFASLDIGWAVWGYDEVFGLNRQKEQATIRYDEAVRGVLFGAA